MTFYTASRQPLRLAASRAETANLARMTAASAQHWGGGGLMPVEDADDRLLSVPTETQPHYKQRLVPLTRGGNPPGIFALPNTPTPAAYTKGTVPPPVRADFGLFIFWVRLLLVLAWAGILLASLIYRGVTDSFQDYVSHLTNWAWTIATIFYTLDLISHLDPTGRLAALNVLAFWWMTFGLQWAVFWLMFIVLGENPDILLEASDRGGGDIPLGTVMNGDRLLHVVPAVINILYLVLAKGLVLDTVNMMSGPRSALGVRVIYWLYAPLISAAVPVLLYLIMFSPQEIYGIDTSSWVLAAVGFGAILLFSALPFLGFVVKAWHDRKPVLFT